MKFNALALAVSAATTFALPTVLAAGEAKENLPSWESACYEDDGPCTALHQAAVAARDSLGSDLDASAELNDISCYAKGAPCNVAKREALALAEAVAEAYAMTVPKSTVSLKDRNIRSTEDDDENTPSQAFRSIEGTDGMEKWCGDYGEACNADAAKVKRAMGILAKATEGFNSEDKRNERRWNWKMKWCHGIGEPCAKVKRAFEHLDAYLKV